MKTAEILQRMSDSEEENAVLLFREGMFRRAYERGAMAPQKSILRYLAKYPKINRQVS